MKHQKLSVLALLLALVCLLSACTTNKPVTTDPPVSNAPNASVPQDTAPNAEKLSGEIVVATWAGDPFESAWKEKAAEFEKTTGVSVVIDAVPWENLREKTILELASRTGSYDVVYVHPSWFVEFARNGYLMPVNLYASEDEIGAYVPNLLEDYTLDGTLYGLPDFIGSQVLAYRTDIFEENNLKAPESWSDILAVCEALKGNADYSPITFPAKKGGTLASVYSAFLVSNGGWYLDENGKAAMNTDAAKETMEFLQKLAQYEVPGYLNAHWDENGQTAANGKAAMAVIMSVNGAWLENETSSATAGKWAYVPIRSDKGSVGGIVDDYCWSVVEGSRNAKAAGEFVKFITGTECQTYFTETSSTCGATTAYYENKELLAAQPVLGALQLTLENTMPAPTWSTWSEEQEVLEVALQNLMSGNCTPEEAVETVQAKFAENHS